MRKIKDIISKPSEAIQAMIDGLLEQDQREDFEIDFSSFGHRGAKFCYGCAATCTVQKIANQNLTQATISGRRWRSECLEIDIDDLARFEHAINNFRISDRSAIFCYFDAEDPGIDFICHLHERNWKRELPKVQAYCDELKRLGL